jgi:hypothetical protein
MSACLIQDRFFNNEKQLNKPPEEHFNAKGGFGDWQNLIQGAHFVPFCRSSKITCLQKSIFIS